MSVALTAQVAELEGVSWSLVFNVNTVLNISASGAGSASFATGPVTFSNINPFKGVGDFPALATYNAGCGSAGVPTCGAGTNGTLDITYTFTPSASAETPLPAALPLFATGLGALGLMTRRRKRQPLCKA